MDASSAVFTLFLVRVDFEGKVQWAISDQPGEDENDPQQADIPDSSVQNKKQRQKRNSQHNSDYAVRRSDIGFHGA